MDNSPTVSICCMTYNQEKYISKAIEGFLKQITSFQIEIIIHDDYSTDNTKKIIEDYAKLDPRIRLIFQKENKYSKNERIWYKYMFPKCQGKYIAICDGDDYWTNPLKLQKQVDFLEENKDYGIIGTRMLTLFQKENKIIDWQHPKNKKENLNILDLIDGNFIYASSSLFKNDFVIENWWNEFPIGDWPLYINQIKNRKIKILDENTGVYRVHNKGIHSGIDQFKQHEKEISCLHILLQFSNHTLTEKNSMRKSIEKKNLLFFNELKNKQSELEAKQIELALEIKTSEKALNKLKTKLISIKKTITYKTILKIELFLRRN